MKLNYEGTPNKIGGKMLSYWGIILIVMQIPAAHVVGIDSNGVVDEVVVNAPRYEHEDPAWIGLMPEVVTRAPRYLHGAEMGTINEIVVHAPRYRNEDIAWCGLMPEVICTAFADRTPLLVYRPLGISTKDLESEWMYELLIIKRGDSQIVIHHN
jgi:hypothetical protein